MTKSLPTISSGVLNSSEGEGVVELNEVQPIYLVELGYLGVRQEVEVSLHEG